MINLNDKQFENNEVKIFNGGEAGVVKDCAVRIEKKGADDPDNMPDYKVIVTDKTGAEINQGIFDNFDTASDKALKFFVRSMKHLAGVFKVKDQQPAQVASYRELLDVTMKICNKNQNNVRVNVAVYFGTEDRPNKKGFLEIDWFWGLRNVEDGIPTLSKTALTERPAPDGDTNDAPSTSEAPDNWA